MLNLISALTPWPSGIHAHYTGDSWEATQANQWDDISGNGLHGTSSNIRGSLLRGQTQGPEHGVSRIVSFVSGGTSDGIIFPSNTIPATFTICTMSRYTGSAQERIIQARTSYTSTDNDSSLNWLHGHWRHLEQAAGTTGRAYYDGHKTYGTATQMSSLNLNVADWLLMCGQNAASGSIFRVMGPNGSEDIGAMSGGPGGLHLAINKGWAEYSDWAVGEAITWNRLLSSAEINSVLDYFQEGG